jgi:hypothetical protein
MAVLRGLTKGMYYAGQNVFNLREIHGIERGRVISLTLAGNVLMEVLLPTLIGSMIMARGYEITFVLGAVIYFLAGIFSWNTNKRPRAEFKMNEVWKIAQKTGFKRWTLVSFSTQMLANMREQILTVIPFMYFFTNEFDLGIFQSLIALVGAIILFSHRNDTIKKKIDLGYLGGLISFFSSALFYYFWTLPTLVIRGMAFKLGYSYYSPVINEVEYRNKELLLSDFVQESSVELMVFNEIIYLIARLTNLVILILIFYLLGTNTQDFLRTMILLTGTYEVINLWLNGKLTKLLRR